MERNYTMELYDVLQRMDQTLFELDSMFDVLHTALDGHDALDPERVQAYTDVLQKHAATLAMQLQEAQEGFTEMVTEQLQEPEDFPLLYTDPATGEKKIIWGLDDQDQED